MVIRYPIKYGRTGGNSVWVEREVIDMLYLWGFIEKKAWISFDSELIDNLKKENIDCPEKVQGEPKLLALLEQDKDLAIYLCNMVKNVTASSWI